MIGSQFSPILQTESVPIVHAPGQLAEAPDIADVIRAKARAASVNEQVALKIATCESSLRQFNQTGQPLLGVDNPQDVGLFQINEQYHLKQSRQMGYDIYSTNGNIDYAIWLLSRAGTRYWNPSRACWSK